MSFLCYEAGYCFCTVNREVLVSGVSFYPLTPPFSSLDSSDHFLREGMTQQKCREKKEWILSYEFQRLRLEITPRAGEKIRETERGEVGGEGRELALERPHRGERSQVQLHPEETVCGRPQGAAWSRAHTADGPASSSPLWLGCWPMRSPMDCSRSTAH